MGTLIFRVTTVATLLGILDSSFRYWLSRLLQFRTLLALCLCMPCLLACLPVYLLALSLAGCYVCLHCFTFSHHMSTYLLGTIIHAFWVVNALFHTLTCCIPAFWHAECFPFTIMSTTLTHAMHRPFALLCDYLHAMTSYFSHLHAFAMPRILDTCLLPLCLI